MSQFTGCGTMIGPNLFCFTVHTDVRLSLGVTVYNNNNSFISINSIGSGADGGDPLHCITDLRPCCRYTPQGSEQVVAGEWYFPGGNQVPGFEDITTSPFVRNRGYNDGTVNLFRANGGVMSPVGFYCCEIPDSSSVNHTMCAVIGKGISCFRSNKVAKRLIPFLCLVASSSRACWWHLNSDQRWWSYRNCRTRLHPHL